MLKKLLRTIHYFINFKYIFDRVKIRYCLSDIKISSVRFLLNSTSRTYLINKEIIVKFVQEDIAKHNFYISHFLNKNIFGVHFPNVNIVKNTLRGGGSI